MIYKYFIGVAIYLAVIPQTVLLIDTSPNNEVDDEPDDVKLNEALLLVDILKSEYVKLLKQNLALRNGAVEASNVEESVEQATCAPTAAGEAGSSTLHQVNVSNTSKSLAESSSPSPAPSPESAAAAWSLAEPSPPAAQWTPGRPAWPGSGRRDSQAPGLPGIQHALRHNISIAAPDMPYYDLVLPSQLPFPAYHKPYQVPHNQNERRNIEGNFKPAFQQGTDTRRFIYNAHPYKQISSTEASTSTKSTSESVARAVTKSTSTSVGSRTGAPRGRASSLGDIPVRSTLAPLAEQQPLTTKTHLFSTPVVTSKTKPTTASQASRRSSFRTTTSTIYRSHRTQDLKLKQKNPTSRTKDPVASQVISELLKEMEREESVYTHNHTSRSPSRLSQEISRRNNNQRADWPAFAFKTSMKVYLERSTRYPIPLPENHAFCYTNPNNRLCRTMIK